MRKLLFFERGRQLLSLFVFTSSFMGVAAQVPAGFQMVVTDGTESYAVDFVQHSNRGPNFEVQIQQTDGSFLFHSAGPVRTYLGSIAALPGAMASAVRRADGEVYYRVAFENGREWINYGGTTTIRTDEDWKPRWPGIVAGAGGAGSKIYAAENGVDLPYSQYVVDGDPDAALEMIEFSFNTTNLIYLKQTGIINQIGRVILRADQGQDPYAGMASTNPLLTEIGNQWDNILPLAFPNSTHDLAMVATSATGGGLASVGVVGNPGYSSNGSSAEGDFATVWRHEVGHNWSLSHFDGGTPEGATINSGNRLARMSASEQAKAINHRVARVSSLEDLGSYNFPIPPNASMDRAEYLPNTTGLVLDVLENDHDANGETISMVSFDTVSVNGGNVSLSAGTGPSGRDELIYQPPSQLPAGVDSFTYRIADTAGRESVGTVVLRPTSDSDLLLHLPLNEGAGLLAQDSSSYLREGELKNGTGWSEGVIDGAAAFDGVDDIIEASALGHATNEFSLVGWIKRDGSQNANAGIVFSRGGTTTVGLNFGSNNELRYHWDGDEWWWNSGLIVPDGVWTFVSLVVAPNQATIYMDSGSGMQSAVHNASHAVEAFDGGMTLGRDPNSSSRSFKGLMDDFRIYCRTLTASEITQMRAGLASASEPQPRPYAALSLPNIDLSWTGSASASQYRVFFSDDYNEVANGLAGGNSDRGMVLETWWTSPLLEKSKSYFWRIDSGDGVDWVKGPVWVFNVVEAGLLARWKMDEEQGAVVHDCCDHGLHADLSDATSWIEGVTNGGLSFDGLSDFAQTEVVNHPTDELTITAWVKRVGEQAPFAGLVFARGGTTVSGLNFGSDNELRYHWNNANWEFDSSLVPPDGLWTFVGLVVSPDQATFYMDSGMGLTKMTNTVSHGVEAFDAALNLGRDPTGGRYFKGELDEVRVYCRALSEVEIRALNTSCPDTFQTWAFEKGVLDKDGNDDSDGHSNLFEYVFGLDPFEADGDFLIEPDFSWTLNVPTTGVCDYQQVIQYSPDLADWDDLAIRRGFGDWVDFNGATLQQQPANPNRSLMTVSPLATEDKGFYRLKLQQLNTD